MSDQKYDIQRRILAIIEKGVPKGVTVTAGRTDPSEYVSITGFWSSHIPGVSHYHHEDFHPPLVLEDIAENFMGKLRKVHVLTTQEYGLRVEERAKSIEKLAEKMAKKIGHGMTEKCLFYAELAAEHYAEEAEIVRLIKELSKDEGDSVQICHPNPDDGPAQTIMVTKAFGDWTQHYGESLLDCLKQALAAAVVSEGPTGCSGCGDGIPAGEKIRYAGGMRNRPVCPLC